MNENSSIFSENSMAVNCLNVERHFMLLNQIYISLVGFFDASKTAYRASVCVVVWSCVRRSSKLVCSESCIAPIETKKYMRIELWVTNILVNPLHKVGNIFSNKRNSVYFLKKIVQLS